LTIDNVAAAKVQGSHRTGKPAFAGGIQRMRTAGAKPKACSASDRAGRTPSSRKKSRTPKSSQIQPAQLSRSCNRFKVRRRECRAAKNAEIGSLDLLAQPVFLDEVAGEDLPDHVDGMGALVGDIPAVPGEAKTGSRAGRPRDLALAMANRRAAQPVDPVATINIDLSSRGSEPDVALFNVAQKPFICLFNPLAQRISGAPAGGQTAASCPAVCAVFHPAWSYRT